MGKWTEYKFWNTGPRWKFFNKPWGSGAHEEEEVEGL